MLKGQFARLRGWRSDPVLDRLLRNSFSLLVSGGAVNALNFLQVVVLTRLLLPEGYGRFTLVTSFVTIVNQFFDVRVRETTVKFGSEYRAVNQIDHLLAVAKLSYLIDLSTGGLAFLLVWFSAPWASGVFLKTAELAPIVQLYAFTLLISTMDHTNAAIMQVLGRFQWLSIYSTLMALLELLAVAIPAFLGMGLTGVFIGLVIKDAVSAFVNISYTSWALKRDFSSAGIFRAPLSLLRGRFTEIARFVFHTNIIAYIKMLNTKADVLILGFFRSAAEVGVYKFARQLGTLVASLADPISNTLLPELSQLQARQQYREAQRLIRRITFITGVALAMVALGIALFSGPITLLLAGPDYLEATRLIRIGVWGAALGGVLIWGWPAALSLQRPDWGTKTGILAVSIQIGLLLALTQIYGALGAMAAFLAYQLVAQPLLAALVWRRLSAQTEQI